MIRLFRLSPSRLALVYIVLSLFVLALFAIPLWYGWRANLGTFREYVQGEDMQRLVEVFDREGAPGVTAAMEALVRSSPKDRISVFADGSKARLAGNLAAWPAEVPDAPGTYGLVIGLGDGSTMRVVASHVRLTGGYHLLMGRESVRFESLVERFWYGITGAMFIVVALGAIIGWLSHRALLSDVNEISRTASAIAGGDLTRRVASRHGSDELGALARTVNQMLEQLASQNVQLEAEIAERRQAEQALHRAHDDLEVLVARRTAELARANESLRRSETYLAEAQRLSRTGSFGWNVSSGEIYWSPETFRIFAYDPATKPAIELVQQRIHPQDRALVGQIIDRVSQEQKGFDLEYRLLMPSGSVKYVHVVGHPSKKDEADNFEFVGAVTDITERKQAERRLRTQYTVTQILAEAATLEEATAKILQAVCECLAWDVGALWIVNREVGVLRCVEFWHKETVVVPQFEVISRETTFTPGIGLPGRVWSSRKPAYIADVIDDANFLRAAIAGREGLHAAFAFPILLGGDVLGVIDFFSHEIRQPDQELLDMMATLGSQIGQFIERKRAEDALRQSEAYLAEAQRLSLTGSFGWNVVTGELFWSQETFCIMGYGPETKPTWELVFQRVHPEDNAFVQQAVDRAAREGNEMDFEHRLMFPDGSVKYVHVVAHATRDKSDNIEFVGAVSDVTRSKLAEEQLRQDERELRRITDAIPQAISVLAPDGRILYANAGVLDYTGLSMEDVKANDFRTRLNHPEDLERFESKRQEALQRGEPFEAELRARRKDGHYRWFLVRYNPLRDDEGRIIRWYATGIDIDDRKQAEERTQKENLALREEIDHSSMFEEIVGSSAPLRKVLAQVAKVAPVDSTVLILGETGTGKELIARAIHKRSKRSARAFVRVNCAAIPQSLIASELFGHEKGAFTGALQRRLGRFELADGGTIFLDEIGELPAETQIALLRVLQEGELERVGSSQTISVDVRVLAATNRDVKTAVAAGSFRQDLFYRLNVFPIQMPSLRERMDDIHLLVEYFIERYGKTAGKKFRNINKKTLELFQAYDWPGNIRELQNVIERAVILCDGGDAFSVDETWLRRESPHLGGPAVPFVGALNSQEKEMIVTALAESHGKIAGPAGAAAKLGIPRQTLESKIRRLSIDVHRFRSRQSH